MLQQQALNSTFRFLCQTMSLFRQMNLKLLPNQSKGAHLKACGHGLLYYWWLPAGETCRRLSTFKDRLVKNWKEKIHSRCFTSLSRTGTVNRFTSATSVTEFYHWTHDATYHNCAAWQRPAFTMIPLCFLVFVWLASLGKVCLMPFCELWLL